MEYFFVEITDTFAGDPNYSWVTRLKVKAETMRGAVNKTARHTGLRWHCAYRGDVTRYDSASGGSCFFIEPLDATTHGDFDLTEI